MLLITFSVAFVSLETSKSFLLNCFFAMFKSLLWLSLIVFDHSYTLQLQILSIACATLRCKTGLDLRAARRSVDTPKESAHYHLYNLEVNGNMSLCIQCIKETQFWKLIWCFSWYSCSSWSNVTQLQCEVCNLNLDLYSEERLFQIIQ